MTGREFLKAVSHSQRDLLQAFVDLLGRQQVRFCVIGGLAVNAYAEPVVSLDLDVVLVSEQLDRVLPELRRRHRVETFANSVHVSDPASDLRIQIQRDPRYQPFLERATDREVLGYRLPVAAIEDVLQGKVWAVTDPTRRPSKRQKDLADILRLLEARRDLLAHVPAGLKDTVLRAMGPEPPGRGAL